MFFDVQVYESVNLLIIESVHQLGIILKLPVMFFSLYVFFMPLQTDKKKQNKNPSFLSIYVIQQHHGQPSRVFTISLMLVRSLRDLIIWKMFQ